jgi:hypothetical protein
LCGVLDVLSNAGVRCSSDKEQHHAGLWGDTRGGGGDTTGEPIISTSA